tara:strand:+ start:2055 stop:2633 length:579 start_codon:yes stop_codon:yes gene_type:complete
MKKYLGTIQSLLIVVLVIMVLFQSQCSKKPTVEPEVIVTIETKWDTVEVVQTEYVPKWKTKLVVEYDTIPSDIDTMMILKDYYAKYSYTDTLTLDTLGFLVLNDTITMNSILSRSFVSNIKIPTTIITKEIYLNKREFYWGLGLQGQTDQLNYLGGELMYKNKQKNMLGLGLGVNQDLQPVLSGRIYWKIGK